MCPNCFRIHDESIPPIVFDQLFVCRCGSLLMICPRGLREMRPDEILSLTTEMFEWVKSARFEVLQRLRAMSDA